MNVIVITEVEPKTDRYQNQGGIIGVFSNLTKAYRFIYSGEIDMLFSEVSYSTIARYLDPRRDGVFYLDKKIRIAKITVNKFPV